MQDHPASKPAPNVRGEDESELQYLMNVIETLAWQLSPTPSKRPAVLLGRYPKSHSPSTSPSYVAAVYSMSKGGSKALELGPEMGSSRREALRRLLEVVEGEVGKGILRDVRRKGESGGVIGGGEAGKVAGSRGEGSGGGGGRMRAREDVDQRDGWDGSMRER